MKLQMTVMDEKTKIWVVNHFLYRYPFHCSLLVHRFEEMHRSFAVGVGEHPDVIAGAVDADEGPSRLRAYLGQ
jgi:predicted protein tyrosine phosphatase